MVRASLLPLAVSLLTPAILTFPAVAQSGKGEFKFEVLSVKPVKRGSGMQVAITNPTPNGFTATATLWQFLAFAYGPPAPAWNASVWQAAEIRNQPNWTNSDEVYAIDARVAQADVKAWQDQNPKTHDLLHAALRAALKERFKLAVHEEPAQRTMFELVVSKRGPRLKPAAPPEVMPIQAMRLESGGFMTWSGPRDAQVRYFHNATMQDLADLMLHAFWDGPVRDRTGLTGRYDFPLRMVPTDEPQGHNYDAYVLSDLGLQLRRGVENRPVLVIDHIEKPTPN